MTFGKRLKELRKDNDENKKILRIFCSFPIKLYEGGIHFLRDERVIIALANHFGVSIDYLFGITNIKNHTYSNDFLIVLHSLTAAQKNEVMDFMQSLAEKNS